MGRALVDAGLIASAREYAVRPHWPRDPFSCLSRKLRSIALGWGTDVDDCSAHPTAKQNIVAIGQTHGARFVHNKKQILRAQGHTLFPSASADEQYERMKALYNSMNMDGSFEAWAR